jgi:putative transposase
MARAKRHYLPGYIWHITHRCHKREFLLKFRKDRYRWLKWLYQARKRYGLTVLNYMVTSNHIHLLVAGDGDRDVIPKSMQLIAGRTGQEYNQRKKRKEHSGRIAITQQQLRVGTISFVVLYIWI